MNLDDLVFLVGGGGRACCLARCKGENKYLIGSWHDTGIVSNICICTKSLVRPAPHKIVHLMWMPVFLLSETYVSDEHTERI